MLNGTAAGMFARGARCVPRVLLGAPSPSLAAGLDRFPVPACSVASFECRLEGDSSPSDFQVCIRAEGGGREAVLGGLGQLRAVAAADPRWGGTFELLSRWCRRGSALQDAIPVVWLEFDAVGLGHEAAPFVICTVDSPTAFVHDRPSPPSLLRTVQASLGALLEGPVAPEARDTIERCLARLPRGARLLHVAARPYRGEALVRLVLQLPWPTTADYLEELGWPGRVAELRTWVEHTCPASVMHSVNLDIVYGALGPRVGIEYCYPAQPATDPRWRVLLDALVAAGACTPEKRAALEEWPTFGREHEARGLLRIDRELLIKVVHEQGAPLRAKAYLPFAARLNVRDLASVLERTSPASAAARESRFVSG